MRLMKLMLMCWARKQRGQPPGWAWIPDQDWGPAWSPREGLSPSGCSHLPPPRMSRRSRQHYLLVLIVCWHFDGFPPLGEKGTQNKYFPRLEKKKKKGLICFLLPLNGILNFLVPTLLIIYIFNPAWPWDPDCAGPTWLPSGPGDVRDVRSTGAAPSGTPVMDLATTHTRQGTGWRQEQIRQPQHKVQEAMNQL